MSKNMFKGYEEIEKARAVLAGKSFLAGLFSGKPDFQLLLSLPDRPFEDRLSGDRACEKVERLLLNNFNPSDIEKEDRIPDRLLRELFDLGIFAMKIPKEYGGLGFSQTNYARLVTLLSSWSNSLALTVSVHQTIGVVAPIILFGSQSQKQEYLPRLAKKSLSAFALTEPWVGSDPANMKMEAVLNQEGTHYIVNGEKLYITNGNIADVIVLMARVPLKGAISAFIVEMDSRGIEIIQRCRFEGCRGLENARIGFTNVQIPVENLIGQIGMGLKYALTILNPGRISVAEICLGMAKQALQPTLDWANFRTTFGKTIGRHSTQTTRIAKMVSNLFAMESAIWIVSKMADQEVLDVRMEAALCKVFCSETAIQLLNDSQIIFGGRGYETAESKAVRGEFAFPIEQLVRDIKLYRIGEGSTDILIPFIAREAMDIHIEKAKLSGSKFKLAEFYVPWYFSQWFPKALPSGDLAEHPLVKRRMKYVERTSRRLSRNILYIMAKSSPQKIKDEQGTIARFANIGIDLFNIIATALYAAYLEKNFSRIDSWDLADHFFNQARARIEGKGLGYFPGLLDNNDKESVAVGLAALEGSYQWLSDGIIIRDYGKLTYGNSIKKASGD